MQSKFPSERNFSGPLLYRQKRDTNNISSGMSLGFYFSLGLNYFYANNFKVIIFLLIIFS